MNIKETDGRVWTEFIWRRIRTDTCEGGYENSSSVKDQELGLVE
jgi:hypothetical protein